MSVFWNALEEDVKVSSFVFFIAWDIDLINRINKTAHADQGEMTQQRQRGGGKRREAFLVRWVVWGTQCPGLNHGPEWRDYFVWHKFGSMDTILCRWNNQKSLAKRLILYNYHQQHLQSTHAWMKLVSGETNHQKKQNKTSNEAISE